MSFMSGLRSAGPDIFGDFLCELPGELLSGCDDPEGLIVIVILMLVLCAILVIFLGMVTAVSEVFSSGGFQQLGLK
jgi:hypothetical protein